MSRFKNLETETKITVSKAERDVILAALARYRASLDQIVAEADSLSLSIDERRSAASTSACIAYTARTFDKFTDVAHSDGLRYATMRGADLPLLLSALVLYGDGGDVGRGLLRRLFGVDHHVVDG